MGLFTPKAQRQSEKGLDKLYYRGNEQKGLSLLHSAAEANDLNAVLFLAELYYTGKAVGFDQTRRQVPRDAEKAMALYQRLPQTLLVKYHQAVAFEEGDGVPRDDEKAFRLFCDVKNGDASPLWGAAWRVFRFQFGEGGYDDEKFQRQAGMRVAVMQAQGRGTPQDEEQALRALEAYDSERFGKWREEEFWDPDALFYLEALRRQKMGEEAHDKHYTGLFLDRLTWVYGKTRDPEIKRRLEEEMLLPQAKARLLSEAKQAEERDSLTLLESPLAAMRAICWNNENYSEDLGDLAFDCLAPLRKAFYTNDHYQNYFKCLEEVSAGMGNLRASCLLAPLYLSAKVTHTHAEVSSRGSHSWISESDYKKEARQTMKRMVRQLQVLQDGKRSKVHTEFARRSVAWFLSEWAEEAKKAAPEEYRAIREKFQAL